MIQIPITRLKFESTKSQLQSQGVKFGSQTEDQLTGTAEYQGVKVSFYFDERAASHTPGLGVLKLTVLSKPFLVPHSEVESKIREWFQQS